jgi:hypothetical protein
MSSVFKTEIIRKLYLLHMSIHLVKALLFLKTTHWITVLPFYFLLIRKVLAYVQIPFNPLKPIIFVCFT